MIVFQNITVISPDGDTRWIGDVPDTSIPRVGELVVIVDPDDPCKDLMKGIVSNLAWQYHNGVAHVTIPLLPVPEKHVTKRSRSLSLTEIVDGVNQLVDRVGLNRDDTLLLRQAVDAIRDQIRGPNPNPCAEIHLTQGNPLSRAVDKARELASSNPVLELEVLLLTEPMTPSARALLRRVILALKEDPRNG